MSLVQRVLHRLAGRKYLPPLAPAERLEGVTYTESPTLERMVFIGGLHRSGTTLLERMLVARYDLSYLRASVPESEGQHMQQVYPAARQHGGPGRFAFSAEMRDALDTLPSPEVCRAHIEQDWRRFVVGDGPVLLEKSPPNLTKMAWLRRVFPGSRFVIMTRDPRAASAATQKWANTSLPELMMHWNAAYSQAMEDFSDMDCTIIRYEDLCAGAEAELSRVAEFLELLPRTSTEALEDRHAEMRNSNPKYIEMHGGTRYGAGIWDRFGYTV